MKIFWMSCLVFMGMIGSAWGQVSFSPEMLALSLQKGSSYTAEIDVVNDQNMVKNLAFSMEYRVPGVIKTPLAKWCTIEPAKISLPPRARQKLTIQLKYDDDFKGECELALFANELMATPIPLNVGVGIPIFLRLNGENQAEGEILSVVPELKTNGQVEVRVQVKNTGALHLAPFGLVWVTNKSGNRLWQTEIRTDQLLFQNKVVTLKAEGVLPNLKNENVLHVKVFWGTLYGMKVVGVPKQSETHVPLQTASK